MGVAPGFSLGQGTRFPNAMKEMIQTSMNNKTVARTSEGLLDMVTDDGCGCGGVCDVGVMEGLLVAEECREFACYCRSANGKHSTIGGWGGA